MVDLIIRNGQVIDGTGRPPIQADVLVKDGTIVGIGTNGDIAARETYDAAGRHVCPGFIDIHSHSDFSLLVNRQAESGIRQGITTLVTGNCGHGPAPAVNQKLAKQVTIGFSESFDTEFTWETFAEYIDTLFTPGLSINVAPLVPHGSIRIGVMGYEARSPTQSELNLMKSHVEEAMSAGAAGFSTGLEYSPGQHATEDELVTLAEVAARHNGIYASHIRNRAEGFTAAVKEALNVARKAGLPAQLSHFAPRPYANDGFDRILEMVYNARDEEGLEIGIDTFPDTWGPGPVVTLLPAWVYEDSHDQVCERLSSNEVLETCRKELKDPTNYLLRLGGLESFYLTCSKCYPDLVGKNFVEIAEIMGVDETEAIFRLLLADGQDYYNVMLRHVYATSDDLDTLLSQPICCLESDGVTAATYGALKDYVFNRASYGYTIRFLREFILEREMFTLEEGIRKMTSLPADQARLSDRGRLQEGLAADIVVLDLEAAADNSTDTQPGAYPSGVELVVVNGVTVLEGNDHTGHLPGRRLPT